MRRPVLPAERAEIRRLAATGVGTRELARQFGRAASHIASIVKRPEDPRREVVPVVWEYARVDEDRLEPWLAEGWEPFAVLDVSHPDDRALDVRVCLRRVKPAREST